jgi:hypothetical protein
MITNYSTYFFIFLVCVRIRRPEVYEKILENVIRLMLILYVILHFFHMVAR